VLAGGVQEIITEKRTSEIPGRYLFMLTFLLDDQMRMLSESIFRQKSARWQAPAE
jgi:hypothetical protein